MSQAEGQEDGFDIAVTGMSGKFPGADTVDTFWENLCAGKESISFFTDEQLAESGVPDELINHKNYVKSSPTLDNPGGFDAAFFGYTPKEALAMDPQHRILLETAWEALENAGYSCQDESLSSDLRVGVYASCAMNTYLLNTEVLPKFGTDYLPTLIGSDKDFLATKISHRLGLNGPSISVQTACSSSLVAIHLACQSLLANEVDMAIVGAATVKVPHRHGHLAQAGSVFTTDGHCRPFDADATGTIFGSGVGAVVLRRLNDAISAKDYVSAVVKASAVNNDGKSKAEYTAPSVHSQADVIQEVHDIAGITAGQVRYIEAHGTGTYLGDPIEIAALKKAFASSTKETAYCAIGSVKANVGHLDAAAGICGFIKLVCCLKHRQIPPQINFDTPNPHLELENSPFFINTNKQDWFVDEDVYAGITSLGIGGTNAHVLLGSAPIKNPVDEQSVGWNVFPISARSAESVCHYAKKIGDHLTASASITSVTDVASTLQTGRVPFAQRSVVVAETLADAAAEFIAFSGNPKTVKNADGQYANVVFMFSGQGSQYEKMSEGLYHRFPVFKETFDYCADVVSELSGHKLHDIIFGQNAINDSSTLALNDTAVTQPALFCVEYALAKTLMQAGIAPSMMLGHSIGEYVAACLAGIFTLDEALMIVVKRGALMQSLPKGSMLNADCDVGKANSLLIDGVDIACINIDGAVVLSGPDVAVKDMQAELERQGIKAVELKTSHAFHSAMMEPILTEFTQCFNEINLQSPCIEVISNLTGLPLTNEQATNPEYWARHLRETVQFSSCLDYIFKQGSGVLLEVGPGRVLSSLANRHRECSQHLVFNTTRHASEKAADEKLFFTAIGKLWQNGIQVDWNGLGSSGNKVPLPSYAFEQQQFWARDLVLGADTAQLGRNDNTSLIDVVHSECSIRGWIQAPIQNVPVKLAKQTTCLIVNTVPANQNSGNLQSLSAEITNHGYHVITVQHSEEFSKSGTEAYCVNLDDELDVELLFEEFVLSKIEIAHVIALCFPATNSPVSTDIDNSEDILNPLNTLTLIAGCVASSFPEKTINYGIVTQGAVEFQATTVHPSLALLQVFNDSLTAIAESSSACLIDIAQSAVLDKPFLSRTSVLQDMLLPNNNSVIAYRNYGRWQKSNMATPIANSEQSMSEVFLSNRCYLVVDDNEGIGLAIANQLIELYGATILLCTTREVQSVSTGLVVIETELADKDQLMQLVDKTQHGLAGVNGVVYCSATPNSVTTNDLSIGLSQLISDIKALEHINTATELDFLLLLSLNSGDILEEDLIPNKVMRNFLEATVYNQWTEGHPQWRSIYWTSKELRSASCNNLLFKLKNEDGVKVIEHLMSLSGIQHVDVDLDWSDAAEINVRHNPSRTDANEIKLINASLSDGGQEGGAEDSVRETVRKIWCEETGIETISDEDDYFSLGGTSLTALVIASRLKDELSVEVDMDIIFANPTVGKLSSFLFTSIDSSHHIKGTAESAKDIPGILSVDQTPFWFIDMLRQGSSSDHLAMAFTISGALDIAKLENSLQKVVDRQIALRMVFSGDGESIRQLVLPEIPVILNTEFASPAQMIDDATDLSDYLKKSVLQNFDLANGPLFRFNLVRTDVDRYVLLVVLHHIISDGHSFSVIFSDLNSFYTSQMIDERNLLPELKSHYPDYVSWRNQRSADSQFLVSPVLEVSSNEASRTNLAHLQCCELLPDHQRPPIQTAQGARIPINFTNAEIELYKSFCKKKAISFYVLLLSAHYLLLRQRSGEQTACIGIPVSLRDDPEYSDFVGMCVNVVVTYISVPVDSTNDVLLSEVREALMHAIKNRYISFMDTVSQFDLERDMSRNPLYQTLIQLSTIPTLELDGLETDFLSFDSGTSQVDLSIHLFEDHDNSVRGYFEYDTELYTEDTIRELMIEFKAAITTLSENESICSLAAS